jgi:hypothetical protein
MLPGDMFKFVHLRDDSLVDHAIIVSDRAPMIRPEYLHVRGHELNTFISEIFLDSGYSMVTWLSPRGIVSALANPKARFISEMYKDLDDSQFCSFVTVTMRLTHPQRKCIHYDYLQKHMVTYEKVMVRTMVCIP